MPFDGTVVYAVCRELLAYAARCCTVLRPGRCLRGLMAVSVAALLGGTGVMPMRERLSLLPLYYSLGLGLGMAALYLLLRSALCFSSSPNLSPLPQRIPTSSRCRKMRANITRRFRR